MSGTTQDDGDMMHHAMDDDALVAGEPLERIVQVWRATAPTVGAPAAAAIAARARLQGGSARDPRTARTTMPWRPVAFAAAAALMIVAAVSQSDRGDAPAIARPGSPAPAVVNAAVTAPARDDADLVLAPAVSSARDADALVAAARTVRLVLELPDAAQVHAVGDFNQWSREATPLVRDPVTGRWSVMLQLVPGRYRYAFLVDGRRWVADPAHESVRDADFGQPTSELLVEQRP